MSVLDLAFTCALLTLPQDALALSAFLSALKIYSVYIFNAWFFFFFFFPFSRKEKATEAKLFLALGI